MSESAGRLLLALLLLFSVVTPSPTGSTDDEGFFESPCSPSPEVAARVDGDLNGPPPLDVLEPRFGFEPSLGEGRGLEDGGVVVWLLAELFDCA